MISRLASLAGAVALVASMVVCAAVPASATSPLIWTGGGGDNNWSTAANWNPAQAAQNLDDVVFPAGASRPSNTNDAAAGLGTLSFTGSGYTIGGSRTTLSTVAQSGTSKLTNSITLPLAVAVDVKNLATADSVLNFGPVELFGNTIEIQNNGIINFSGPVTGGGGLHQDRGHDDSRTVFSGVNTYTGPTSWQGGDLIVNGSQASSALTVGPGVLEGTGTVGSVTMQGDEGNPGVLSPGDPIGTLHAGATAIGPNSILGIEGSSASPGQYDQLVVNGPVSIGGELVLSLGFEPSAGTQLKVIDNDGTDPVQGSFSGLPEGATFGSGGSFYKITYKGGDGNDVVLTATGPPPVSILTAPGSGGGPNVKSFGARNLSFFAGQPGTGGASVAAGNVLGGDLDNIVVGSGAGVPSRVNVYNQDGSPSGISFSPYGDAFTGGVNVGVADIDGDGVDEIVTGAGAGGGPNVRVFAGDGEPLTSFFAYDAGFHGGVTVAGADVTADGIDEIVTGPGPGGGPNVKALSADGRTQWLTFTAYSDDFHGGVNVAGVDVDGDGRSEIVTGPGPGGGPHVRVFGRGGAPLSGGFFAFDPGFTGGVFVGSIPDFGRQHDDILVGAGPGGGPNVKGFLPDGTPVNSFFAYDAGFHGGVRVAGALLNAPQ